MVNNGKYYNIGYQYNNQSRHNNNLGKLTKNRKVFDKTPERYMFGRNKHLLWLICFQNNPVLNETQAYPLLWFNALTALCN
jgi:hypothetical protein